MAVNRSFRSHGTVGTLVFHGLVLLLCVFLGLQSIPQQEEGLLVNFGDTETGSGVEEPMENESASVPEPVAPPVVKTTPPPATAKVKEAEKINTQNFEEAAALKEEAAQKKKEEAKKRLEEKKLRDEKALAEQREREAQEQIRKEELEKQRKAQELARKAQEAKSNISKGFAGKGSGANSSEGEAGGEGNQGKLTGDPNATSRVGSGLGSQGNSFSLSGRSLIGSLPKPAYTVQEEGVVVVEIQVDKYGKVTGANVILKGTTIQNTTLWNVAKEAAQKARFNENPAAPAIQKGTITYHFRLD